MHNTWVISAELVKRNRWVEPFADRPRARNRWVEPLTSAIRDKWRRIITQLPKEELGIKVTEEEDYGGPGSGHWGHKGIKGQRGGSAPGGAAVAAAPKAAPDKVDPAELKEDWKSMGYHPEPDDIDRAREWVYMDMDGWSPDGKREAARSAQRLEDYCEENPVSVRRSVVSSAKILEEGRFKTQFETGRSGGVFKPEYRREAEKKGMGVPEDIDRRMRPVYGYVHHRETDASVYGQVEFVMKDSVKYRTTVTVDDSLDNMHRGHAIASPMNDVGPEAFDTMGHMVAERRVRDWKHLTYIEAQIHGGVTVRDVDKIIVHGTERIPPAIARGAEKWGIEVEHDRYSD